MDITMIVDTFWVVLAAMLVFFMNLGFASVESGMARSKNAVNILSKNFIVFAVSSLGFMLLGWGLMFGGDNPFVGTEHLFILGNTDLSFYNDTLTSNVPFWGKFFFQLVFCGTAATIVSGAVAERVKYISFILFSFALTLIIYPIVGHWIWGGGFDLLGVEALGVVTVGAFVFGTSALVWLVLKKTIGIRVSLESEIEGLDIGEHGNSAYPDFAILAPVMESDESVAVIGAVKSEIAIPVVNKAHPNAKMTKVTIIMNSHKFTALHTALDQIGITGLTVTNVLGHGMQKGHPQYYRGAPVEKRLLPKVQVDIVVCGIPTETLVDTVKKVLYTGNVGDGKIFIYDVENVIKVSTGEEGYNALQDE